MIEANLSQYFAGRTKEIFPTGTTTIRPFTTKPVMHIAFGIGVFLGYEGLEWIRDFHVNHFVPILRIYVLCLWQLAQINSHLSTSVIISSIVLSLMPVLLSGKDFSN